MRASHGIPFDRQQDEKTPTPCLAAVVVGLVMTRGPIAVVPVRARKPAPKRWRRWQRRWYARPELPIEVRIRVDRYVMGREN